ncbi:urease accessory protein UreD [Kitasatospora sp. NPDC002227]|uniref:urease accessory protein UreD n=1 Tax=Kitasatospora sp. NPDC002227 TaxID=3154773 RepID=UPI003330C181
MTVATLAPARIVAVADGRGGTALPVLESGGPLALRRTAGEGRAARVLVVGAMAAPVGGDRLALDVRVEAGAALVVGSAAATVSLPGAGSSSCELTIAVAEGAELDWYPEPVVAASGSHLVLTTRIELAAGARLRLREEQILGRHHDWARQAPPGRLTSRLTVRQAGRLILDQQTDLGPADLDSPAQLGAGRAAGQLLTVGHPAPRSGPGDVALLTLAGVEATLLTAVAADALRLRRLLAPVG